MVELREATQRALAALGNDVFDNPRRFVGAIMDFMDPDAAEVRVLEVWAGDAPLFTGFASALREGTVAALLQARGNAESRLRNVMFIEETVAKGIADGIVQGIGDYLDITRFCPQCGIRLDVGETRCASCGQKLNQRPVVGEAASDRLPVSGQGVQGSRADSPANKGQDKAKEPQGLQSSDDDANNARPDNGFRPNKNGALSPRFAIAVCAILLGLVGLAMMADALSTTSVRHVYTGVGDADAYIDIPFTVVDTIYFTTGDNRPAVMFKVRNDSDITADIEADIYFSDADGINVAKAEDVAWGIGPGEVTLLVAASDEAAMESATCLPIGSKCKTEEPLLSQIEIAEESLGKNRVRVRVTNTGDGLVALQSMAMLALDDDELTALLWAKELGETHRLTSGESMVLTFEEAGGCARAAREYFVFGKVGTSAA